jgi:hypothetical protein
MTDVGPKPIPYYVIQSAVENAKEHDEYVVVRSDHDYQYARTADEASTLAWEMSEVANVSPTAHSVQTIDLQQEPPEA